MRTKTWDDVIELGPTTRGTRLNEACAPDAEPRKLKDHAEAARQLFLLGYHPAEIRDHMMEAGFFPGKTKVKALLIVRSILRPAKEAASVDPSARKPARRDSLRVDLMLKLAAKKPYV